MEEELVLSGYCKTIDAGRTVIVEDGEPDCLFQQCPHVNDCPLAEKMREAIHK